MNATTALLFECPRVQNIWILIGSILKVNISYKHLIIGNTGDSEAINCRNLVISYITYAIYKHWIMSENKKINFNTCDMMNFIKNDLFKRTLYVKDKRFVSICDKVIKGLT